ncbi:MAG: hypothetical protein JWP25_4702 [Bradyrhizobium sp.]|nr:hypothetical protein [Bradyrhizobium sp.]
MLSCSHWGMYPKPQKKYSAAWYDEQRRPQRYDLPHTYYDANYLHGCYQRLDFGPHLS